MNPSPTYSPLPSTPASSIANTEFDDRFDSPYHKVCLRCERLRVFSFPSWSERCYCYHMPRITRQDWDRGSPDDHLCCVCPVAWEYAGEYCEHPLNPDSDNYECYHCGTQETYHPHTQRFHVLCLCSCDPCERARALRHDEDLDHFMDRRDRAVQQAREEPDFEPFEFQSRSQGAGSSSDPL